MTWTQFMDMHSGGGQKLPWAYIYIEAPEAEAERVFRARFGRNPNRVTCTCCGEDYSASESKTLAQATAFNRECRYVEDERGWSWPKPDDYREGFYLEPEESVPEGYKLSSYRQRGRGISVEEYLKSEDIKVIYAHEITVNERQTPLEREGYVWAGDED